MCKYKISTESPPYPRVAYDSECGIKYAVMEGYEFDTHLNCDGTQKYSVRTKRLAPPSGRCMKCREKIEVEL